jgi:hypothetical protein
MNKKNETSNSNKPMAYDTLLSAVITSELPNKFCILNNYIGTVLQARNVGKTNLQVKLKKYADWFTVPIANVELL